MNQTNDLQSGQLIGHYELIECVGRGGEATVWSAWDARIGQMTAFKASPRSLDEYSSFQFGREVNLLRHLSHPHILTIHDYGELPGIRYLIARYLPGGTLHQRIPKTGMALSEVIRIGTQVAQALDYLHSERVVHRDLKPSNILFDVQNNAYVADFGLARQITSNSTAPVHSQSGTLAYMPPEQFTGSRLSLESDLYSLGITLFEMLTGVLPFAGEAMLAIKQINSGDLLPDVHMLRPELPAAVTDLLRSLTNLDAHSRPSNASEALRTLAETLALPGTVLPNTVLPTVENNQNTNTKDTARLLLDRAHASNQWVLSLTELIMINAGHVNTPLLAPDLALLLRSALVHGRDVSICWHALPDNQTRLTVAWDTWERFPDSALRVIDQLLTLPQTLPLSIPGAVLPSLCTFLKADAPPTPRQHALALLERAVHAANNSSHMAGSARSWHASGFSLAVDTALADLAHTTISPEAEQAASLLGQVRSTSGVHKLIDAGMNRTVIQRLADVYAIAHGLPPDTTAGVQLRVAGWLAARQLTRNPREIMLLLTSSLLGAVLGFASIIYLTYNSSSLFSTVRILNTLGTGLLFGVVIGSGAFLTRWLAIRLQVLPWFARLLLSSLIGCLVITTAFTAYYRLYMEFKPRGNLLLIGSAIWAMGVTLGAFSRNAAQQWIFAAAGIFIALEGTWYLSQMSSGARPPDPLMYFTDQSALPVSLIAAVLAATGTIIPTALVLRRTRTATYPVTKLLK